jgi:oxygen-independent coproporphyrinogen-3 oxidase
MLNYAAENLSKHNYIPYYLYRLKYTSGGFENIGWSKPGFEGIYNKLMMEDLNTVFAMGAGGVTKLVLPTGRIERIINSKYPREYILQSHKIIDKIDKVKEFFKAAKCNT